MRDIVYVVGPGESNEELRYSLRSLASLPHGRVFLVGSPPSWTAGVTKVAVAQQRNKWLSSTLNLSVACSLDEVSDDFIYMNDDMFIMKPVSEIPVYHRGSLDQVIAAERESLRASPRRSRYVNGAERTRALLVQQGLDASALVSYEVHTPMPVSRREMGQAILLGQHLEVLHKRTLYGNLAHAGGILTADVKVTRQQPEWSPEWTFISTDDTAFARDAVGEYIRDTFTEPGPYER